MVKRKLSPEAASVRRSTRNRPVNKEEAKSPSTLRKSPKKKSRPKNGKPPASGENGHQDTDDEDEVKPKKSTNDDDGVAGIRERENADEKIELPPDVEYFPNFMQDNGAYEEIASLDTYRPKLRVYGKEITQSRSIAAYATEPLVVKYSGAEIDVHVPFPPAVDAIGKLVEEKLGEKFNHVMLNRYDDGTVYIGRHSDTTDNRVIAAVSLGAERTLIFTPRPPPKHMLAELSLSERKGLDKRQSMRIRLKPGSLLVMRPPTQEFWKHEIPKEKNVGGRISLTFRQYPVTGGSA